MQTRQEIASPFQPETEVISAQLTNELLRTGAVEQLSAYPEIWHGRSSDGTEWQIDPFHAADQGYNIYDGVLYASPHYQDAKDFAVYAAKWSAGKPEVQKLVAKTESVIITGNCDREEGSRLAIDNLTDAVPISSSLEHHALDILQQRIAAIKPASNMYISRDDTLRFAHAYKPANVADNDWLEAVQKYASALNAKLLISGGNLRSAATVMCSGSLGVRPDTGQICRRIEDWNPFSREYVAEVFRRGNIVGQKMNVHSAKLNRPVNDSLVIWDKTSLQETRAHDKTQHTYDRMFEGAEKRLTNFSGVPEGSVRPGAAKIRRILQDPFLSPKDLMATINQTKFKQHFDKPTGVWEGYTLGEHTEAALGLFERYYADALPAHLVGFMRTVLFLHDIGKPDARKIGASQTEYNVRLSGTMLEALGHEPRDVKLVTKLLGEGGTLFSDFSRYGKGKDKLQAFLSDYAKDFSGKSTPDTMRGVLMLLETYYGCDAGAYTEQARYQKGTRTVRALRSLDHVFEFAPNGTPRMRRAKKQASV